MTAARDPKQKIRKKYGIFGFPVNKYGFLFFFIWELEASRCVQNDVRGCANIFHYRPAHSENFIFLTIFDPPPPGSRVSSQKLNTSQLKYKSSFNMSILRYVFGGDINVDCIFTATSAGLLGSWPTGPERALLRGSPRGTKCGRSRELGQHR